MDDKLSRQLGGLLVQDGVLAADDVEEALRGAETEDAPFAAHLVTGGWVSQDDLLRSVAGRIGVEFLDPEENGDLDPDAVRMLPDAVAVSEVALPIRMRDGKLMVAVVDPYDEPKLQRLAATAGATVVPVLAPRRPLEATVRRMYLGAGDGAEDDAGAAVPLREDPGRAPDPVDARTGTDAPDFHINELLVKLLELGASDLHLAAGSPPQIRVRGDLRLLEGYDKLLPETLQTMIYSILTSRQREQFEEKLELDASHPVTGKGRFRVNVFYQRGSIGAVIRAIPNEIMSIDDLGLPPIVHEFAEYPRGLVLVTGTTGSGKSTTLAAMIDEINGTRPVHIMTIEDPIEFIHRHRKAIINQREVGVDTTAFASALRHALRQDPDVILVGEMRDLETMATALTAAETGHLVLATLHTQDAPGSVERIIDVFPADQQQQVRVQLASSLRGVLSQQLLPTVDNKGRIAAVEVMVATPGVSNLVREGKIHQIRSAMQSGGKHGMQTMDQALAQLVKRGTVDLKLAVERAHNMEEFMRLVGGNR